MESSKKTQLLYKLFMRGYKNPNSTVGHGSSPQRSHSYSFGRKMNQVEESEQRYKKRQRSPEESVVEPPSPSSSVEIVELNDEPEEVASPEPGDKLLDLKWTCSTLDKRRDVIADYFQRSVLKQRQDYDDEELQSDTSLYENYCIFLSKEDNSPSPEPIYAEICSDFDLQHSQLDEAEKESIEEELASLPSSEQEHLYENLDIIRHEMFLRRQSMRYQGEETSSIEEEDEDDDEDEDDEEGGEEAEDEEGEIDEESILENKPAIKNYWESKMRENNAASQFARSNFGVPSTTIIDKINDEIREDYLRNLELMNDEGLPRSSASDTSDEPIEFDSFDMASSNGSSPFGQPNHASSPLMMSESPTLIDSGHQSQESHVPPENEMEQDTASLQLEPHGNAEVDGNSNVYKAGSPIYKGYSTSNNNNNNNNNQPKPGQTSKVPTLGGLNYRGIVDANKQAAGGRGKIENHVTHYIAFNKPFARTVKPHDEPTLEREKSPPKSPAVSEAVEEKFSSLSFKPAQNDLLQRSAVKPDVSYLLATSRLKKEIEDNLKREKELKDQGRVKTLSVETVSPTANLLADLQIQEPRTETKAELPKVTIPEEKPVVVKEEVKRPAPVAQPVAAAPVVVKKDNVQKAPKEPVVRRDSFPEVNPPRHQTIQHIMPNFKIGKNFNSLERYIMYSSLTKLNFRSMPGGPNGSVNEDALSPNVNNVPFDFESTDSPDGKIGNKPLSNFALEEQVFEDEEPVEKVRKNYIPTEKRIQNELQEMVEREEELKRSRQQWKSTPNLSNLTEEDDQVQVVVPREAPVRVVNEKRRRSALISKWEDMISKNNQ